MGKTTKKLKIAIISIVSVMFIGLILTAKDIYQIYTTENVNQFTNKNLGLLKYKVTKDEKNDIKKLSSVKMYLTEKRIEKNQLEPGVLENKVSKYLDEKLNEYTIKYLLKGYELEEDSSAKSDLNQNNILNKLKNTLSEEDYNKLKTLVKEYDDGNYTARDDINSVIEKYNSTYPDIITTYLTESNSLELEAFFDINKNAGIEYKSIKEVTPNKLSKSDYEQYQNIWNEIKFILPNSGLENFDELYFSTDGKNNELASVTANNEQGSRWIMSIDSKDVGTKDDKSLFYETIFHEYFHYMSLNNNQVTYTYDYNMKNYCEEGIASHNNSYINEFYNKFWKDIIDDRNADKDNFYFYERHKDSFVDEYASTDPAEDLAETFSYFILKDKPTGNSIKDEKIKFFYNYGELVKLRNYSREKINYISKQ